jgi:hypothetical protein
MEHSGNGDWVIEALGRARRRAKPYDPALKIVYRDWNAS